MVAVNDLGTDNLGVGGVESGIISPRQVAHRGFALLQPRPPDPGFRVGPSQDIRPTAKTRSARRIHSHAGGIRESETRQAGMPAPRWPTLAACGEGRRPIRQECVGSSLRGSDQSMSSGVRLENLTYRAPPHPPAPLPRGEGGDRALAIARQLRIDRKIQHASIHQSYFYLLQSPRAGASPRLLRPRRDGRIAERL